MLGETWVDQYQRLQRSYALLQRAGDQNTHDAQLQQPDSARDVLYHFCCDAWHLKDWIVSQSTVLNQSIKDDVWTLFDYKKHPHTASTALMACADIANSSKHLELTKRFYTSGGPAEVTDQSQGAKFPMTFPFHFAANHWTIDVGGDEYDALDLSTQAISDWDTWLTGHSLLPLPT
jgi:hypothetical protein